MLLKSISRYAIETSAVPHKAVNWLVLKYDIAVQKTNKFGI